MSARKFNDNGSARRLSFIPLKRKNNTTLRNTFDLKMHRLMAHFSVNSFGGFDNSALTFLPRPSVYRAIHWRFSIAMVFLGFYFRSKKV